MVRKIADTWALIMMAGMGTRMKSERAKVLHDVCGQNMARWVLDACDEAGLKNRVIVVGHQAEKVIEAFPEEIAAIQKPQKGTGHAVMVGMEKVPANAASVVVLSGDVPCLNSKTLRALVDYHRESKPAATVLTFCPPDPTGYGRIIRNEGDQVLKIVEHKDLRGSQKEIDECNSGIYVFDRAELGRALKSVKPSPRSGEYHLPDVLLQMIESGERVEAVGINEWIEAMGVNNRLELSEASDYLRWRIAENHMAAGVTIVDPGMTWIGPKVKLGRDCTILPGSIIMGGTTIGEGGTIGPYSDLQDVRIGKNCTIAHSVLSECRVDDDVRVGPFAHIRPGTRIRKGAKVGDFVEMKMTDFGERSKCGHLTYLGDAVVGKDVNIGAGTITCNFDGKKKHVTKIEDGVFIGSDCILVAPIKIGKNSYTAAGSTLNEDVPPNSLAFGRAKQSIKKGWTRRKKKG